GAEFAREPDGAGDIDAGRAAEEQSLVPQQVEHDRHRLFIGDLIRRVDRQAFEILRDAALADAFGDGAALRLQAAMRVIVISRRPCGIGETDANFRIALAQIHRRSRERAARADGADEAVDLAVGLTPDLRARRLVMRAPVRDVVELIRPDGAVRLALGDL